MPVHSRVARRFSFLLSPAGIVIGYVLALVAATAGPSLLQKDPAPQRTAAGLWDRWIDGL
jgi:hypothetical protein